ncbi:Imm26 family immunity protein [Cytobacillus massiliigabonensis]|uniref:Imm26 family immunity protein n=1 Tax=Cytobacillus massiliigabonensis TaxID=1871011 RepID=UPI000C825C1C|nr:Imm26 family immunity protein [Cytobacillus massiliigabonensis]
MKKKFNEGDIFIIPMQDDRFAICQIVCALKGRFKKALSFGVIRLGTKKLCKHGWLMRRTKRPGL